MGKIVSLVYSHVRSERINVIVYRIRLAETRAFWITWFQTYQTNGSVFPSNQVVTINQLLCLIIKTHKERNDI